MKFKKELKYIVEGVDLLIESMEKSIWTRIKFSLLLVVCPITLRKYIKKIVIEFINKIEVKK